MATSFGNEERASVADMEMCTSPTSSITPTLPVDALPNLNLASSQLVGPWFVQQPETMAGTSFGVLAANDPYPAMYLMLGHLSQQYTYLPHGSSAAEGCSTSRQKEIIRLKSAVLYPPNPHAPLPPLRDRPPGCRTVFIGGLPDKCTEEILRELLDRCGEIQSVRMSKKNFAHIRFVSHDCVDRSLYFSGYRMKVEDRSDKEYTGRIHVDYAQARDDMHEWEMEKRVLQRDHRQRDRSTSPDSSAHFNENEAATLLERLKDIETFTVASQFLLNWLDNGECNKKTSTIFYGMIAAVNAHVRRLLHDRKQYDEELREFREKHNQRLQGLMAQFCQIEKVFRLARKQKNWDHFSRAQRKNVDIWLKHAEVIRKANEEAMLRDRHEEEMETSDDNDDEEEAGGYLNRVRGADDENNGGEPTQKKSKSDQGENRQKQIDELISENARLKSQLDEMQKMQKGNSDEVSAEKAQNATSQTNERSPSNTPTNGRCSELESRLIALLACFLNVHPLGASVDYIWAYLRQIIETVRAADIENTLEGYPHLFRLQSSGVGAAYERKWMFIGFQK